MSVRRSVIAILTAILFGDSSAFCEEVQAKIAIKSNGVLLYNAQKKVDNFADLFLEGNVYGRLRNNHFYFAYNHDDGSHYSQVVSGAGGSVVYKSADLAGFSFGLGGYGTYAYSNRYDERVAYIKSGKDTFSRYNYINYGEKHMLVLGQTNLDYRVSSTDLRVGRQLVETFYTKSNDSKMIPNTFDGAVLTTEDIAQTKVSAAYLLKQKLRDHSVSHNVFMVGDSAYSPESKVFGENNSSSAKYTGNDDSAMLKGLTYSALKNAGKPTDAPLIVLDIENKSIENLKINFASYVVPELLSQAMGELNYKMDFGSFSVTPGIRYIQQFDHGAGAIAGASLTVLVDKSEYKNPDSLNAKMIAARVVTQFDKYKINLAFTDILDEADLVTPWRGFPTSGYTRSMGMYNWKANTKSYRLELQRAANQAGVYRDLFVQTSVLYIDGDVKKSSLAQSMFYYAGFVKNFGEYPSLQAKLRIGYRDFIGSSQVISDYVDSRLEFNYLF